MSAWMPITTETSRGRFHARHRKGTLWSTLRRDAKRVETRSDSKRGLLPALKTRLAVSTTSFDIGAPPPAQTRNATSGRGPVTQAEAKLMQEAKEFAERTCASIDERRSFAESLLLEISHREADVHMRNKGKRKHYPAPAGSDVDIDASGMRGVGRQASSVSALDDTILAQVLADPTEWEDTLDINTLPCDEQKPRHRRSGSVRLMQTVSEELQVAKWRALAMFALNKGDAKCQDGRLYACRVDGCDSVRPTFRSLIYHLHMHDVGPDNKRSAPVREYCNACDTTFETRRDLIVHRCPVITDILQRHASEKTIHVTSKDLLCRLTELANRIKPITTKSQ